MGMREVATMGKREDAVRELIRLLLDFDPAAVDPNEALVGWKAIAVAAGFSADTVQRTVWRWGIRMPRWGRQSATTPVFLPRGKIVVLRRIMMGA